MKQLEQLYYESLPYAYAALAIFAFANHKTSKVAGIAALVLAFCSYQVFTRRRRYRNAHHSNRVKFQRHRH